MSVWTHIFLMFFATVLAWAGWFIVLVNVNPASSSWWGFVLFYVTFFLSLFGTLTIAGYSVRSIFFRRRMSDRYKLATALRHAFLWSSAFVVTLSLQAARLLTWWILIIVIAFFILIEFTAVSVGRGTERREA